MVRSVVVTGADSGIGLVSVIELAAVGYDVVGTVRTEVTARDSSPTGSSSSPACSAPTSGPRRRRAASPEPSSARDTQACARAQAVSSGLRSLPVKIACLP